MPHLNAFLRYIGGYRKIVPALFQIFLLMAPGAPAFAQQETANWFFGYGAGFDFSSGAPVFQKGSVSQWEGCATISDSRGRLLFYSNGNSVWNKEHKRMKNGTGLKGHNSSTQSSVIVPKPGSDKLFYIFTVAAEAGNDGLQYSLVDMSAGEGLGDVIEKNTPLLTPVCEKITAVKHQNNRDIWVIAHKYNSDEYIAYRISSSGVSPGPVISKTGNVINGALNTIGYLKASPNGRKIAAAHLTTYCELMDFDPSTGKITNAITVQKGRGYPYGIEFSGNAEFLYVSELGAVNGTGPYTILQFRVSGSVDSVAGSRHVVANGNIGASAGALQLAPDNKIYVAINRQPFLACIQYPERAGGECGFVLEHLPLDKARSGLGLPTFIQSYFTDAEATSGSLSYLPPFILILLLILLFLLWRRKKKKKRSGPPAADRPPNEI